MQNKFIRKYIWGTNLISIVSVTFLIILLLPFYVKMTKQEFINYVLYTGGISSFLLFIYHFVQKRRLIIVLKKGNARNIYLTPFYCFLHKMLDYVIGAPILFLIFNNYMNIISWDKFIRGTLVVMLVGPIVSLIVYLYAEGLINEELKKYKEKLKGFPLFSKMIVVMFIVIIFSFFMGIVFVEFKLSLMFLFLSFILVFVFALRIKKTLDFLLKNFSAFTSGKFSLNERLNIKTGDEIDELGSHFNAYLDIISGFINDIKITSEKMNKISEVVASSNEELTASIQQISSSLENLNHEIGQISQDIKILRDNTETVNAMAENMESQTMMLKKIAEESENIAIAGISGIEEVLRMIELNIKSVGEINKKMVSLISSSDEIVGFASMINDVAEDTDLLALNASIEAARVGEMGKGFSVIAEEIRNLSNLSRDYLTKVNDTLEKVKASINEFKTATESSWSKISQSIGSLDSIRESLNKISQNIALTTNMTNQVSETIKEEVLNVSSVFLKIDNISKSIANVSATVQQISASTEEQMASLEEISSTSHDLLNSSKELEQVISKYI